MAVELATAYVRLQPSARGFQAAAEREIGPELRRASEKAGDDSSSAFSGKFTSGLRSAGRAAAIGLAAGFTGAAVLGRAAVNAASDLEETQSKVNTVFGESAEGLTAWSRTAATRIGQSQEQALAAAGSFGNMFTQLGLGQEVAAQMSVQMVELSSDFASFHNADISEVIAAQEAAFRGEYDSLQRFVPTINAAAVEQRALEMGLADANGELDAQDKALAVQQLMMEGAGAATGDFARTSDSLANQQRTLAAKFENVKASIGRVLIPILSRVVGFVVDHVMPAFSAFGAALSGEGVTSDGFAGVMERIGVAIRAVWEKVSEWMPKIREVIGAVFDWMSTSLFPVIASIVEYWMPRLGDAFKAVSEFVQRNWPAVRDVLANVFEALMTAWVEYGQPAIEAAARALQRAADWVSENWPQISSTIADVFQKIKEKWDEWGQPVFDALVSAGQWVVAWVADNWPGIYDTISGVMGDISASLSEAKSTIETIITEAVDLAISAWNGILAVYSWFVDEVYYPLKDQFDKVKEFVERVIGEAVDLAKTAWEGIKDVWTFFRDEVYNPVSEKVTELKDHIVDAFTAAKDGVKTAWNLLKDIVKEPINVVIGFYNNGIRAVWNAVISKIPGVGDLDRVATLNRGGWVPGTGNRDTVPALLTPGEFVITKSAAKALGPGVLHALNRGGTLDPGIFGYATGGYARSADEALEWARKQAGKPYMFPMVGPDAYDCSGLTSALINYILGNYPYSRRHSSGTVASDGALRRGGGDNPMGLLIGARPPFMVNQQGATVGHMAASLMGVGIEATPPRVRVGGAARGATASMFNQLFHLPGYGGLSDADKAVAAHVAALTGMSTTEGGNWFSDLLAKLVNKLPGMIYDFFMKKLPSLIVDAVKDMIVAPFSAIRDLLTPSVRGSVAPGALDGFANGGWVDRNGPILVGERGPELLWGRRGMYVQPNHELGGSGRQIVINNNHAPFDLDRAVRQARMLAA